MRSPPLWSSTWTLLRLLPRLGSVRLAAGLLPGVTVLVFAAIPLLPVFDWAAIRAALSALAPLPAGAAAAGMSAAVALGSRKALRAVLHGDDLRFLDRLPLPARTWGPGLAALAWEAASPVALASWFWGSPHPLLQGLAFLGVGIPLCVAAAGSGPRALGWGSATLGAGAGLLALGRAIPESLPLLGPATLAAGVLASGPLHADLRMRGGGLELGLPGRAGGPARAWLRWDLTLVLREEPRALLWAGGAGALAGLLTAAFVDNAELTGGGATTAGLVFFGLAGVAGALPLVRALDLQDGRLAPASAPLDPGARARALGALGALGLLPATLSVGGALLTRHPPGLGALFAALAASAGGLAWMGGRVDRSRGHRINLGWVGGLMAGVAALGAWAPLGPGALLGLAVAAAWRAKWEIAQDWGRIS